MARLRRALLTAAVGLMALGSGHRTARADTPIWVYTYWRRPWTAGLGGFGLTAPPDGSLLGASLFVERFFGYQSSFLKPVVRLEGRQGWQALATRERPIDLALSAGAAEGCVGIRWRELFKVTPCLALEAGVLRANRRQQSEPAARFLWLALAPMLRLQWLPDYAVEISERDDRWPPHLGWEIEAGAILPMRRPVVPDVSSGGDLALTRAWGVLVAVRLVFVFYEKLHATAT